MKTKTLAPLGIRGLMVVAMAVVAFASVVMFAYADTTPTLTTTAHTKQSSVAITSARIGTKVFVSTVVASSSTTTLPTGTVTFNRYAGTSCSGTTTVQADVPLVNGVATSSAVRMIAGGLSFVAHYNGDTFNAAATGPCLSILATSTNQHIDKDKHDNEGDHGKNESDHGDQGNGKGNDKGNNGHHWGWFNFLSRFGSWPWGHAQ